VKLIPLGDAGVPVCEGDVCEIPGAVAPATPEESAAR
jgi:hypothetical protein